jgi:hypothetical protein
VEARSDEPFVSDGVYVGVPYRVLGSGEVEARMQGGLIRFQNMDHFTAAVDGKTSKQPPTETSYDERRTKDIPEMRRTASGSTIRLVQEAEADKEERQRGEEERRRQKVEDKRRLDDAKLEEERRRKEEQRRKRLEQGPQQPVKPWLLPLIGAGAASLPVLVALLVFMLSDPVPMPKEDKIWGVISAVLCGLYGGAAGMLIPRFGILKAMAIPVIPILRKSDSPVLESPSK